MKEEKSSPSPGEIALIGAGIAAVAATAYLFLGPKGKKNQKVAKSWAINMKKEVIKKLEMAKEISKPIYDDIIDSVATEYTGLKNMDEKEIRELAKDLKKHWKTIASSAKKD